MLLGRLVELAIVDDGVDSSVQSRRLAPHWCTGDGSRLMRPPHASPHAISPPVVAVSYNVTTHTVIMAFPEHVKRFPRDNWDGVMFTYPPIPRGLLDSKARWAARTASLRWQAALDAGDAGTLDAVDFTVAVFDVACNMYVCAQQIALTATRKDYMRDVGVQRGGRITKPEDWRAFTDRVIAHAYCLGCSAVSARFPEFSVPSLDAVRNFARGAMDCVFEEGIDSWGRVYRSGYDEVRFTDRYMPHLDQLPLRAFTVVDHTLDGDPAADDRRLVLLLDGRDNVVRQYRGRHDRGDDDANLPASPWPTTPTTVASPTVDVATASKDNETTADDD